MTNETVAEVSEVGGLASAIASLPEDIRGIVVERALREALGMEAQKTEAFDPGIPGADGIEMVATDVTTTDRSRVTVFSMITGEPHTILRIDRPRVLRTNIPGTNRPAFWAPGMPGRPPFRDAGTIKCLLHPESPERAIVDALGFNGRYCNDGNMSNVSRGDFRNIVDRDQHMQRKHTAFWAAWERSRTERTAQEAIEVQRSTRDAMVALAERLVQGAAPQAASEQVPLFECEDCDDVFQSKRRLNAHIAQTHAVKTEQPATGGGIADPL